ncbi:uncharacterized protein K02A2.6-like [Drosophila montana]|uniref:uncharacterized protein K02A2.6-like n=1 Tax=Drosophila montana TaxID=40370 RepID=UPI00313B17D7
MKIDGIKIPMELDTAGAFKGPAIKVHLKLDAKPIFARARDVPFALRDAYAKEIDEKIAAGFYKRVDYSEWGSTTHVITKKTGGIRITGNYKPTVNAQMIIDEHQIPKTEDIFNQMKGCTVFAHLDLPVIASLVARETRKDQHLGKILQILQMESGQCLTRNGYKSPKCKYEISSGCITFEHRVVIPTKLQKLILHELHKAHLGIVKMKGIARSFVYWPGIDKDIENAARTCEFCAKHANQPQKCSDHYWEYPKSPWKRIHIDYAGPFEGAMLD